MPETAPITLATWAKDEPYAQFCAAFAFAPEVRLLNARTDGVDWDCVDGLILSGGTDLGAESLAQPVPDPTLIREPDSRRDAWDFAALKAVLGDGRPILAVCRGHQVLNVALGGTLLLHVEGHQAKGEGAHGVRYGREVPEWRVFPRVNSRHHQAVAGAGEGLVVEGWSEGDGLIEQVRYRRHPWCVGVQYHPETTPEIYHPLFAAFVEALRAGARRG